MARFGKLIIVFSLFCLTVLTHRCGKIPSPLPLPFTGSIRVTAMDTSSVDSIQIDLNDQQLGLFKNPALLTDVTVGFHKLFVKNETSAGTTKTVEVLQDQTTPAWFWLVSEGPYVGNQAPEFDAQDIQGNSLSLEGLKGKVILLAFFEYT